MTDHGFTIDHCTDERGNDRYFVADPNGNWIGDPHDTRESAAEELREYASTYEMSERVKAGELTFEQAVQELLG